MTGISESLLGREGIELQPIQQLLAIQTYYLGLHIVEMRVDEAGHQEETSVIDQRSLGISRPERREIPHRLYATIGDAKRTILDVFP